MAKTVEFEWVNDSRAKGRTANEKFLVAKVPKGTRQIDVIKKLSPYGHIGSLNLPGSLQAVIGCETCTALGQDPGWAEEDIRPQWGYRGQDKIFIGCEGMTSNAVKDFNKPPCFGKFSSPVKVEIPE